MIIKKMTTESIRLPLRRGDFRGVEHLLQGPPKANPSSRPGLGIQMSRLRLLSNLGDPAGVVVNGFEHLILRLSGTSIQRAPSTVVCRGDAHGRTLGGKVLVQT